MWKAKRKSRRRKNDRKMEECEEFRKKREQYIAKIERMKREFEEFIEKREQQKKKRQEAVQELIEDFSFISEMRDATKEEQESVNKYINSISKDTGINFWNILGESECDCNSKNRRS